MSVWVVVLGDHKRIYGPFGEYREAGAFAEFLSQEVDPATVEPLKSPAAELLSWRAAVARARNGSK